ncbi:MAG: hypothetical protein ACXWMN_07280, partial [Candidatus Limnocylindria bacterium]
IDGQPQLGGAPAVRNALTVASQGGGWRHPCEIHRLAVRRAQRLARRQPHPPKHRLLRPRDLEDEDLALFSRASDPFLHEHLLSAIAAAGYRFRSVRDTGCATARDAMLAVASGLGVAFRPFSFRDAGGGRKASSSGASSSRRW